MKTCKICGKNIDHTYGNTQHCLKHLPKKIIHEHKEPTVTVPFSEFRQMQKAVELLQELQEYIDNLREEL